MPEVINIGQRFWIQEITLAQLSEYGPRFKSMDLVMLTGDGQVQ